MFLSVHIRPADPATTLCPVCKAVRLIFPFLLALLSATLFSEAPFSGLILKSRPNATKKCFSLFYVNELVIQWSDTNNSSVSEMRPLFFLLIVFQIWWISENVNELKTDRRRVFAAMWCIMFEYSQQPGGSAPLSADWLICLNYHQWALLLALTAPFSSHPECPVK